MNERSKAIVFLVITALLWSLGGLLIKLVNWNPVAIAGTRSAIAAGVILLVIKKPKTTWSAPKIGGALAYAATVILFVTATKITTAANAIMLQYTSPIYVAILGMWLLKERTKLFDWLTIFIVFGGMAMFFVGKLSMDGILGNILAAASGVSYALMVIFLRMQKDGSPVESVFWGNILTAIIGLPFMFQSAPDALGWLGLILLGTVQLGIPYVLYSMAIKHVTALEAILIPVLEPILNPVWVFLMLGETPGIWALIGGIIVLSAITVRCLLSAKPIHCDTKSDTKNPQPSVAEMVPLTFRDDKDKRATFPRFTENIY